MGTQKKVIWESGPALEGEFGRQKRSDLRGVPNPNKTISVQTPKCVHVNNNNKKITSNPQ